MVSEFYPLRLSILQYEHIAIQNGGWGRNRTGVHGVAVRCITTLPSSQVWELVLLCPQNVGFTKFSTTGAELRAKFNDWRLARSASYGRTERRAEKTQVCVTQHVFSPNYKTKAHGSELSGSFRTATRTNLTSTMNHPVVRLSQRENLWVN